MSDAARSTLFLTQKLQLAPVLEPTLLEASSSSQCFVIKEFSTSLGRTEGSGHFQMCRFFQVFGVNGDLSQPQIWGSSGSFLSFWRD